MGKELLIIILFIAVLLLIISIMSIISVMNLWTSVSTFETLYERFHSDLDDFNDEMLILAETLQTYHELLDDYQIPMISNPTKEQRVAMDSSEW